MSLCCKIQLEDSLEDGIIAFYANENRLLTRGNYYEQEYAVQRIFKVRLHLGPITVIEIGNLKREIAYYWDTINVAARIQEQCKTFERTLLISDDAHNRIVPF